MGLHMDPTLNTNMMHELVVAKLYENGRIDDSIKTRFIDDIYDIEKPITRHTMLRVIDQFL
jgi:hypothetical protein